MDATDSNQQGEDKETKMFFGMRVKKDTTPANIFAIILIPSLMVTVGAYTNAQMPYLLQSDEHFDIE